MEVHNVWSIAFQLLCGALVVKSFKLRKRGRRLVPSGFATGDPWLAVAMRSYATSVFKLHFVFFLCRQPVYNFNSAALGPPNPDKGTTLLRIV